MEKHTIEINSGVLWRALLIVLAVWFVITIKSILLLLFISIVVVSAASPIIDRLEAKKIPRALSVFLLYIVFLFLLGYLISLIIPLILTELKLLGQNIPQYYEGINGVFKNISRMAEAYKLESNFQKVIDSVSNQLTAYSTQLFSNTVAFVSGTFKVFVVFSLSFYMLVKKEGIQLFLKSVTPEKHQTYVLDLAERVQSKMGRWLVGQLVLVLLIFTLDYLALLSLGVPYALTLATIGGLLEIIPYIGPTMAIVPAALTGLTVSPLIAMLVILLYSFIQQLENHLVTPLVMKKAVGLNPVAVILALLIGGKLAGLLGVLLAVPAATAIGLFLGDLLGSNRQMVLGPETPRDLEDNELKE